MALWMDGELWVVESTGEGVRKTHWNDYEKKIKN